MSMSQRQAQIRRGVALAVIGLVWCISTPLLAQDEEADLLPYHFLAIDLDTGDELSLAQLTEEFPLVLLTWAEDCPHCRRHMPYFAVLASKIDPLEANVVQLVLGGEEDATLDYLDKYELPWPVLWGVDGEHDPEYDELGWPSTYVFARDGELVGIAEKNGPAYIKEVEAMISDALIYWD